MNRFLLALLYCAPLISLWAQPPSEAPFTHTSVIEYQLETKGQLNFSYSPTPQRVPDRDSWVSTLKLDHFAADLPGDKFLTTLLFQKLADGSLQAQHHQNDSLLSPQQIQQRVLVTDSIVVYDDWDSTQVRGWRIVRSDRSPFVNRLQIKQQWRIHDAGIELRVQGISPIMRYRKPQGELLEYPLYHIPQSAPPPLTSADLLNDPNHIWLKLSEDYFDLAALDFSKEDRERLTELLWESPRRGKIAFYASEFDPLHPGAPLPPQEFKQYCCRSQVDTIITFHPLTYDERITVVLTPAARLEGLVGIKMYQLWIWAERQRALYSVVLGVAPVFQIVVQQKGYSWTKDVFGEEQYLRYDVPYLIRFEY
ncbi:MAG: hypothetical protein AAFR05_06810 [Bacteroidota bacterium]